MATIITAENGPAVLAQLAEQQEQMAEAIEGLVEELANQTVRGDRHDEQLRTQAASLRSTAAQLSRTIADTAKASSRPAAAAAPNNGPTASNGGARTVQPQANRASNGGARTVQPQANGSAQPTANGQPSNNAMQPRPRAVPDQDDDDNGGLAGGKIGGKADLGPLEARAEVGANVGGRSKGNIPRVKQKWL